MSAVIELLRQEIERLRAAEEYNLELFRSETAKVRAATIEECALIVDDWYGQGPNEHPCAVAIRALKEQS